MAFVLWGVAIFLTDEGIAHTAKYLYDWSSPDSCLTFNAQGVGINANDPDLIKVVDIYKQLTRSILTFRSLEQLQELIKPWKVDEKGFISLTEWNGIDESDLGKDSFESFGKMGGGYGGYLIK